MGNKALERYLRELKKALACSRSDRERLLSQTKVRLADFLEENPDGEYEALALAFGPPEVFAGEMLDTLDQEELTRTQTRRKWLRRGIAAIVAVALVLCAAFYATQWYKAQEIINGDFRIVKTDDFTERTEDEFNDIFGLNPSSTGGNEP